MNKTVSALRTVLATLCAGVLFVACGGGDEGNNRPLPSVEAVLLAYNVSADNIKRPLSDGKSFEHPSIVTVSETRIDMVISRLVATYKGKVVLDETARFPGLTEGSLSYQLPPSYSDYGYVLLFNSNNGPLGCGIPQLLLDGEKISIPPTFEPGCLYVKEYKGWLILLSTRGSGTRYEIAYTWSMYNPITKEFVDYGEYGPP